MKYGKTMLYGALQVTEIHEGREFQGKDEEKDERENDSKEPL